ncbi:single-stranded-DNA-specific exonuclease RecJ [Neoroseomonas oryzicola]|uniref:Single-stranded-DNA-specific exonuclease RecJ n=1 Tax=Neoroseomonas oryzicola TaxID=535904 RepID=A0A9X9WLY7_9PROT|nr:single-stranded-DNA-specific exonuclease RecJ [Neoroseomonas oryzicola]MBR0661347.1 single-stranded-DNA-specific exonuclease RecJ [Neoroseomonas oryzicola]NKE18837.1 single-stranded-DNA-specific exonuclease RecJ [Neoroseomonas oryzicola]
MDGVAPQPPVLGVERSVTGRRWIWRPADPRTGLGIAQRLGLPEVVGRLLAARGIGPDHAGDFLEPTLRALMPDPSALMDMDAAADRLAAAVRSGEHVAVFGDYDVDGACSGALMSRFLRDLGCEVSPYVPDRLKEGYGPNAAAIDALCERGATLIVCVDCGIAAAEALAVADGRADVVVLDHHKAEGPIPRIIAAVNPNRLDCGSGLHHVCAAAVAFLAAAATVRVLRKANWFARRSEPDLLALLDLVALATVCDVMPLTGFNRALVAQGLKVMGRRGRAGIAALLDVTGARDAPSAHTLGFLLGPRINASGRIGEPDLGLRLLLCEDAVEARAIAEKLDTVNRRRQEVEGEVLAAAHAMAERQAEEGRAVLLLVGEGWHPGVVGIVAGRMKERFNRPACVAGLSDGLAKGSGRSVPGVDLGAAVIAARQSGLLETGGGHAMAAGFSFRAGRAEEVHAFFEERLKHAALLPAAADLLVEGTLNVLAAQADLAQEVARLAPFGPGNEEPVFAIQRARVVKADRVGKDGGTVRAIVEGEGGGRLKTICFRAKDGPLAQTLLAPDRVPLHLCGHLRAEQWNGETTAALQVVDAAPA